MIRYLSVLILISVFLCAEAKESDWEAGIIKPSGRDSVVYVDDYADAKYGDKWDFEEGDLEGLSSIATLLNARISNGNLNFYSSHITELSWGYMDSADKKGHDESICHDWKDQWRPWAVRITIKQSQLKSDWYIKTRSKKNGKDKLSKRKFTVEGQKRQTVTVDMGVCKQDVLAIGIGTRDAGNKVELDMVEVVRPSLKQYLLRKFYVSGEPYSGELVFSSSGGVRVFLNGKKIAEEDARSPFSHRLNKIGNIKGIVQGNNILAIEQELVSWENRGDTRKAHFFLEGIFFDRKGKDYRVVSDENWLTSYKYSKSWHLGKYDARNWNKAHIQGSVNGSRLDGRTRLGKGDYLGRPYMGRVKLSFNGNHDPFVFADKKNIVSISVISGEYIRGGSLDFAIRDSAGELIDAGKLELKGNLLQTGEILIENIDPGIYSIDILCKHRGQIIDHLRTELISVGKLGINGDQAADRKKMVFQKKFKMEDIDNLKYGWLKSGKGKAKSAVIPSFYKENGEDYVSVGNRAGAWVGINYKIKNTQSPHLVRVYTKSNSTDDSSLVLAIVESSQYKRLRNIGPSGAQAKAVTGSTIKASNIPSPKVIDFLFWPGRKTGNLVLINNGSIRSPAPMISRVELYEFEDIAGYSRHRPMQDRAMVGPFSERIDRTVPRYFYNGPNHGKFIYDLSDTDYGDYYSDWYLAFRNLIMYLKYTGQNTYFAGIYMYYGSSFPSYIYQGHSETGMNFHGLGRKNDAIRLMARMFEKNNLNLILGVQFMGTKKLLDLESISDGQVRQGQETLRLVSKKGEQVNGLQGEGFNFLNSVVKDEIFALANEIGVRYQGFPSIKGITWMRVPEFRVGKKDTGELIPMDIGYGDTTIRAFEKDTGIKVPVPFDLADRFNKRYLWIMENKKQKWMSWRSTAVNKVEKRMHNILQKYNPSWCYWRLSHRPGRKEYEAYYNGNMGYWDIYRWQGIDPELYESDTCFSMLPTQDMVSQKIFGTRNYGQDAIDGVKRWNKDSAIDKFRLGGMFFRSGFTFENKIAGTSEMGWDFVTIVASEAPENWDEDINRINSLKVKRRSIFPIGWSDDGHFSGHEAEIGKLVDKLSELRE